MILQDDCLLTFILVDTYMKIKLYHHAHYYCRVRVLSLKVQDQGSILTCASLNRGQLPQ